MGKRDYYKIGDHNVICDRCGAKFKASECALEWDNLYVCKAHCWEARHPQDFVRGVKDEQRVEIARPRASISFISDPIIPEDL